MPVRFTIAIAIAACVAMLCGPATAAEAVGVEIEHEGNRVAGYTITFMGESDAQLLALLATQSLSMEPDYRAISDIAGLDRLVLDGGVSVGVHRRGDSTGTQVELEQLTLIRSPNDPNRWQVSADDVDRITDATGVMLMHAESPAVGDTIIHSGYVEVDALGWIVLAAIGIGFVVVMIVVLMVLLGRARRSPR